MHSQTRLDLRSARMLVIDDNTQSAELIAQMLMGFRVGKVEVCRTPQEGAETIAARRYDLLIIDADMQGVDGITFTRDLRTQSDKINYTTPVILISSHTPVGKVQSARDAGANLVVKTPIAPATLLNRIVWLARNGRPFVSSDGYCGPDRRFKKLPPPEGTGERRADALALTASPEREMSQDEVDALFG
ncbi:MAG: response regulator [Phenylobacterium sp.]|uniref:response regulator n=1 Tax=Phenylobacterium sp. TaxID=1871053 RepID=UPI001A49AD29|nr:response regulator [Phenylobacterium sp.]MBL8772014.1 response regulator [Phenylobacterium sp.]